MMKPQEELLVLTFSEYQYDTIIKYLDLEEEFSDYKKELKYKMEKYADWHDDGPYMGHYTVVLSRDDIAALMTFPAEQRARY